MSDAFKKMEVCDLSEPGLIATFERRCELEDTIIITIPARHMSHAQFHRSFAVFTFSQGTPMSATEYETCKRLWQMFFKPMFDEAHGVALVRELLAKRQIPNPKP